MKSSDYDFIRYLAAKKHIDDNALNRRIWHQLSLQLSQTDPGSAVRVLELGAGIGTMVERMVAWGLLDSADYTAVDGDADCIRQACRRLDRWARNQGFALSWTSPASAQMQTPAGSWSLNYVNADIHDFFEQHPGSQPWDLGLAHAFMDLVDIAEVVPQFSRFLKPGGLLYLTLNYDGETILLPTIDGRFDSRILQLYNQSMDQRRINGKKAGDSRTGRHLLAHFLTADAEIVAAGSSDWIVFSTAGGYTREEAYFLHYLVHTIRMELKGDASLESERLDSWIRQRHAQIETGELIFIARQMDVLARRIG